MDYTYYELDGAFFRARAGTGLAAVDDVFWPLPDGWTPYKGDPCKPVCFGSRIEKANLPVEAGGKGRCPANVRYYKDGEARAEARALVAADNKARFREVGSPGEAWIIPGFTPKP